MIKKRRRKRKRSKIIMHSTSSSNYINYPYPVPSWPYRGPMLKRYAYPVTSYSPQPLVYAPANTPATINYVTSAMSNVSPPLTHASPSTFMRPSASFTRPFDPLKTKFGSCDCTIGGSRISENNCQIGMVPVCGYFENKEGSVKKSCMCYDPVTGKGGCFNEENSSC